MFALAGPTLDREFRRFASHPVGAAMLAERPRRELNALLTDEPIAKLAHVGEVRQKGFMIGIELVKDKASNKPYPLELKMGACVAREARRHGVIIRPLGNVVVLMPTFSFTQSQIAQLCRATAQAIQTVTEG